MNNILIIGAAGQLGSELRLSLIEKHGIDHIIATDVVDIHDFPGIYEQLDATDRSRMEELINKYEIGQVYHLAAILSAKGEQNPQVAWDINMTSLLNVLELATTYKFQVYWPSSIAVFGPDTPKDNTPQKTVMNPSTVYGISKLAGERWCEYYHNQFGVDVRSLRYPGLIGYKSKPGGGTTDYAVDIYWKALENELFNCFLRSDTLLPMMFMDDAVRASIELMEAPAEGISIRSSYNLSAMSFAPIEIFLSIKKKFPEFEIDYNPDFRQKIADTWPNSIDDMKARTDWGWNPAFDLEKMTEITLEKVEESLAQ